MATIRSVRDLRVYQHALQSLEKLYDLVYSIPRNHSKQRRQLTNSAEAIAPMIAEGFAKKKSEKEAKHFFTSAMAESDELLVHLDQALILSKRVTGIRIDLAKDLLQEYSIISKELNKLIQRWNQGLKE